MRRARAPRDAIDRLAPLLVGHADDGDLGDGGMREQRVLDLDRRHVLAALDDHVLLAVRDRHVALVVDGAAIAGVEPPVDDRRRGGLGLIPVPLEHHVAAREHFAFGVDVHLDADRGRTRAAEASGALARRQVVELGA